MYPLRLSSPCSPLPTVNPRPGLNSPKMAGFPSEASGKRALSSPVPESGPEDCPDCFLSWPLALVWAELAPAPCALTSARSATALRRTLISSNKSWFCFTSWSTFLSKAAVLGSDVFVEVSLVGTLCANVDQAVSVVIELTSKTQSSRSRGCKLIELSTKSTELTQSIAKSSSQPAETATGSFDSVRHLEQQRN